MSAQTVEVALGDRSYPILIGEHLLRQAGALIAEHTGAKRVLIVTDDMVARFYLHRLTNSLEDAHIPSRSIIVKHGEASKSIASFSNVIENLLEQKPDRKTAIVALGGGVAGDLAGFCASVLLRGVPFIQIPTSLLAQVDSSVGGKTGINSQYGKNFIGSFYQPKLVLADISSLRTLEPRQLLAGYAEILKYALINDAAFFDWLGENGKAVLDGDPQKSAQAVAHCCKAKAAIVAEDETEAGKRALLNLGHTFGHALEAETGFGDTLLHGEAVAIGMLMACELSIRLGHCDENVLTKLRAHYEAVGLPQSPMDVREDWDVPALMEHFTRDKKVSNGKMTFILLRGIGDAFITQDVDEEVLTRVMMDFCLA